MKRKAISSIILILVLVGMTAFVFQIEPVRASRTSRIRSDGLINPSTAGVATSSSSPGYYETSEYFIGKVACDIIFIESNGVVDVSTEDWTSGEKSTARSATVQANQWWRAQSPNGCAQGATGAAYTRYTNYEPISRPSTDEYLWISEAVTNQPGYPGTPEQYIELTYAYVNGRRNAVGSDWFFLIFMIDSSNDTDGCFADEMFAYAPLGGPFIVMTYTNNGYGPSDLNRTAAHEIGHIFYATDESDGVTENSGYLNVADVEGFNGVMYGEGAFNWAISPGTWGQVGWRDSDSDGIQDIVDTFPDTFLNPYSPDPTTNPILTYAGTVTEIPYPNNNPYGTSRDITINKITNVEFRVDGGAWMNATSDDGAFNEDEESFSFTTLSLSPGTHTIETLGINSVGNVEATYGSDMVTIEGHDVAVTSVTPSKTVVGQDYMLNINVTVANQGDYSETFNIIVSVNTTEIETREVTLSSWSSTTLTFTWNTAGFACGNYTISAVADVVPGETDIEDNTYTDEVVQLTIPGDIDGDFEIKLADLVLLAKAYGSEPGDPNWGPNADIDGNNIVGLADLVLLAQHYGQHYP